ncbi:MAG: hypothetical protein ABR613_07760 [Actinomycetota bacterium]
MRNKIARRVTGLLAAGLVSAVAFAPAAFASDSNVVSAEPCPEGYKGVVAGTSGGFEVFACTNLLP